jgi:methyltransferase
MKDVVPFSVFISALILQRLIELMIARRNEKWLKAQGALEFGMKHYRFMVWMHICFFISLLTEKLMFNKELSPLWSLLMVLFVVVQFIRIWVISSLGRFWNTKIIVLPNAEVVRKGPYRYLMHPNYFVVAIELVVVPLTFEAYATAILFTLLNIWILSIRIPEEERALKNLTEYDESFQESNRFIPKFVK